MCAPPHCLGENTVDKNTGRGEPRKGFPTTLLDIRPVPPGHVTFGFPQGGALDQPQSPRYTACARKGISNAGKLVFDKWIERDGKPIGNLEAKLRGYDPGSG